MKREIYEQFKARSMHNGGQPLLKREKEEVDFDPSNPVHMEAADLMFSPEPSTDSVVEQERPLLLKKRKELVQKRRAIPFRFKLEPPYMDLRSMVLGKTMQWAIDVHRRGLVRRATIHTLPAPIELKAKKTSSR
jgi:hypothetical protein